MLVAQVLVRPLELKHEAKAGRRRDLAAADESALRATEAATDEPALNAAAGAMTFTTSAIRTMRRKMRFAAVERWEHAARDVLECEEDDDEKGADRRDFATTPAAAGDMQARGCSAVLRVACFLRRNNTNEASTHRLSTRWFKFCGGAGAKAEQARPVDVIRHVESKPLFTCFNPLASFYGCSCMATVLHVVIHSGNPL